MDAFARFRTLFAFKIGGLDLKALPCTNAEREAMIAELWQLIREGQQLGIPASRTVEELREALLEIQRDGGEAYRQRYGIAPKNS